MKVSFPLCGICLVADNDADEEILNDLAGKKFIASKVEWISGEGSKKGIFLDKSFFEEKEEKEDLKAQGMDSSTFRS